MKDISQTTVCLWQLLSMWMFTKKKKKGKMHVHEHASLD